jgi:Glycosyl hydrolase family 59/F5/8 type C domain
MLLTCLKPLSPLFRPVPNPISRFQRWLTVLALLAFGVRVVGAEIIALAVDPKAPGRVFEGIGALSAGASSRLLIDYPEPQRSEILDLLFKPGYAASLHHLKVELGGDINSTDGIEPSHARTREELGHPEARFFDRGYESWLMREARKRNPQVYLDILQWGAPAWVGDAGHPDFERNGLNWLEIQARNRPKFYSQDNVDFVISFIQGFKRYAGLDIDFCGIWNETPYEPSYVKLLRKTLDERGLGGVRIVGPDHSGQFPWDPAKDMVKDPSLAQAVYAFGAHYPSDNPPKDRKAFDSIPEARQLGKPLWASEDGPMRGDWVGAGRLARIYNRNYIVGRMTKTISWSLITSYYDNLPVSSSGAMKANTPWSGAYEIQPAIWAMAHSTQFIQPGWRYLDDACGFFGNETGSYVTLVGPTNSNDYSIIIESIEARDSQVFSIRADAALSDRPLAVWRSRDDAQFENLGMLERTNGVFQVEIEPGAIYSLSTTRGQRKGTPKTIPEPRILPLPFKEDFEKVAVNRSPRFFADQGGGFEVAKRPDGQGQCLRQVVFRRGVDWMLRVNPDPYTVVGSSRWTNYEMSCDVLIQDRGHVALYGRLGRTPQDIPPKAYVARLASDGKWQLMSQTNVLRSGSSGVGTNEWHRMVLRFAGSNITFSVEGMGSITVRDTNYASGMVGVGSGFNGAFFDNLEVRPIAETGPVERGLIVNLAEGRRVRASSVRDEVSLPSYAVDADNLRCWSAAKGDLGGAWLEVDFGKPTRFDSVAVSEFQRRIGRYEIQVPEGANWRTVLAGESGPGLLWGGAFAPVTAPKVRLRVASTMSDDPDLGTPQVVEMEIYSSH